jgi:hypothetical protein
VVGIQGGIRWKSMAGSCLFVGFGQAADPILNQICASGAKVFTTFRNPFERNGFKTL